MTVDDPSIMNVDDPSTQTTPVKITRKRLRSFQDEYEHHTSTKPSSEARKARGALLAVHKPSYCLKNGVGSCTDRDSHRSLHRKRLWRILQKLVKSHNWAEASGVLSVLMQGTAKDHSISQNRDKFTTALELLHHVNGRTRIKVPNVYVVWMKKIGPLKNWSAKDRFAVQLEYILSCLQCGNIDDAHQSAINLMTQPDFASDPISNLVVGLTFCQLWYSEIPQELQMAGTDLPGTYIQSDVPHEGVPMRFDYSKEDVLEDGADHAVQSDSTTSIAIDKEVLENKCGHPKENIDVDKNVKTENSIPGLQSQEMHTGSVEENINSDSYIPDYAGDIPYASIFYSRGLPPWLLPMKLSSSRENLEDIVHMHQKLQNDHYTRALKHLRVALYSTPPMIEAFHPLIQMLLLGDRVNEALDVFENIYQKPDTALQLRIEADLLEHFDSGNFVKLRTCYEDILKKDPTSSESLARLVSMHRCGDYETQSLVEMIALHLDATHGTCDTWKELASCFLKLSHCGDDIESICADGSDQDGEKLLGSQNKIPELFTNRASLKSWIFRARWWLNRHFKKSSLMSEIASGDLKLMTNKAAAAAHIYGRNFRYVTMVSECLERENDMELFSFLQMHILNSVGFFCSVDRNNSNP